MQHNYVKKENFKTKPETKRGEIDNKIGTLRNGGVKEGSEVKLPVIRKGEGEKTVEREAVGFGAGGNERGVHETVHELELSGSGKPCPSRERQGKRVSRDGTCQPIKGLGSGNVQIPEPSSVHYPSQFSRSHHTSIQWKWNE